MIQEILIASLPFIGQMADLASTEAGVRRGLVETNPSDWAQDTNKRRIVKVGVGVGMTLLMVGLKRKGVSKRTRIAVSLVAAATGLVPAGVNISRTW